MRLCLVGRAAAIWRRPRRLPAAAARRSTPSRPTARQRRDRRLSCGVRPRTPVDMLVVRAALPESRGPRQAARLTTIAMLRPDRTREMPRLRRHRCDAAAPAGPHSPGQRLARGPAPRRTRQSCAPSPARCGGSCRAKMSRCRSPARCGDASPAALNLDRAARLLKRGVERAAKSSAVRRSRSRRRQTLLGAPSGLAMWTKEMVAGTDPSPDLPDERPLRRGSGSAD